MSMASGRWLGVRLDLVAALLIAAVALAAVLTSQDAGNYALKRQIQSEYFSRQKEENENIFRGRGLGSHIKGI